LPAAVGASGVGGRRLARGGLDERAVEKSEEEKETWRERTEGLFT